MKGSCACGKVTYRCNDPLQLVNCHCTLCRGINGSAFSSYVVVMSDSVEISGQADLGTYTATDKATKHFCSHCGTPLYNANPSSYPGMYMFFLGTVQEPADLVPGINIFCRSKLEWVDALSGQPSFPAAPQRRA